MTSDYVDAALTLPFIGPFPWPSYNYSLYKFVTQKAVTCLLFLNCSCNCSGAVTSGLTLFCSELALTSELTLC
jgi:hypothetical protein